MTPRESEASVRRAETVVFEARIGRLVGERHHPAGDAAGVVLLLHGSGQRRHSWRETGRRVSDRGWTVVALDARGHGESARGDSYLIDDFVDDLADVVGALGERPVVVGASLGGMTGLIGEGERGCLARALVLLDVAATVDITGVRRVHAFMRANPDGFATLEDAAVAVAAYRTEAPSAERLRRNLTEGPDGRWRWHWDPASLPAPEDPTRGAVPERAEAAARAIRVPTMLVRGTRSDVVDEAAFVRMGTLIPHARMVRVDAGHMIASDDNDTFVAELTSFLADEVATQGRRGERDLWL